MSYEKDYLLMPGILLIVFICVFLTIVGFDRGIDKMQQDAIRNDHAEWVADQSGKPQFKWKEAKP